MYKRTLLIATGLAPALLIGACTTVGPGSGTENRGLESVHQPVVSRNDYILDVATSGGGLAAGEERRLAGWMGSLRLGYGRDQVAIDDPSSNGGPVVSGVREDVAREVARYGLLVSDEAPLTDAPVAPGMIRVVVSRMQATVPGCPDFSRVRGPDFEGHTGSNHGCAVNANLAAMVGNPLDLVHGQSGSGIADTATSGRAIDTYRKATPTGAGGTAVKTESAKGGN